MSECAEGRLRQWGLNVRSMIVGAVLGGILVATGFAAIAASRIARFDRSVGDLKTEVKRLNKELSDLKQDLASRRGKFLPLVSRAEHERPF